MKTFIKYIAKTQSKSLTKILPYVITLAVFFAGTPAAAGAAANSDAAGVTRNFDVASVITDAAACVYNACQEPGVGMVGGDWAILGLARGGCDVPGDYYEKYYAGVEEYVKKRGGVLDERKYTEYSRVVLGLTAAGYNPHDVCGYDLTAPLLDFDKTVLQGVNGPAYALLALGAARRIADRDGSVSAADQDGAEGTAAIEQSYVNEILSRQNPDGGFSLNPAQAESDADVTCMVIQALAGHAEKTGVRAALDMSLNYLSKIYDGYASGKDGGVESVAQAAVALCELDAWPGDARFNIDGISFFDILIRYYVPGKGFERKIGGGANQMASEQSLYALAAIYRAENGMPALYDMIDAPYGRIREPDENARGPEGANPDINATAVVSPGKTFADIRGHVNQAAIEAMAERGVISGKNENSFDPDAEMTRAEFATIVVRGLGLDQKPADVFSDIKSGDWFFGYISAAYNYGIVYGVSETEFGPDGLITREEAATMISRAAALCGADTGVSGDAARDALAQFGDYRDVSDWAFGPLAFCYDSGILSQDVFDILPLEKVKRCEIADMLYNMMRLTGLL